MVQLMPVELTEGSDDIENKAIDDPSLDITYRLIYIHFNAEFKNYMNIDSKIYTPVAFRSRIFQSYLSDFRNLHSSVLLNRSAIIQELFILHQTAKTLQKFNDEVLKLSYTEFRTKFYFPNIVYLLIRFLPAARGFLQKTIRTVYASIQRKSSGIINLHENAIYLDKDVIKSDVLYSFLGNTIKKINPFDVRNVWAFYRKVFLNIFYYYFKSEQKIHSSWASFWDLDETLSTSSQIPTREVIYRDVLVNLQISDYQRNSPTLSQIHYNYNVFKNVIINNEFQNIYFTTVNNDNQHLVNHDNQYKILSFYQDVLDVPDKEEENVEELLYHIKKLPTIYRLLKAVHIISKRKTIYAPHINVEILRSAILDELKYPFRNLISDEHIHTILDTISTNFAESILSGEYINLLTLTPIKIEQASFVTQVQKFIRIVLGTTYRK